MKQLAELHHKEADEVREMVAPAMLLTSPRCTRLTSTPRATSKTARISPGTRRIPTLAALSLPTLPRIQHNLASPNKPMPRKSPPNSTHRTSSCEGAEMKRSISPSVAQEKVVVQER